MALTLAEAAKLSNDLLLAGVIETIIKESPVLQQLPFVEITGNALTYNRENAAPTAAFYNVGDAWAEDTPTFTQVSAALAILASMTDLVSVEAVEYPAGQYPPSYARYRVWAGTLTLLVDSPPAGAESVDVSYGALHTLDATSSTLPSELEDVVATGAAAYAALEWANFAINRINVGGEEVWRQYLAWGQERLASYLEAVRRVNRRNAVRPRTLYAPAHARSSQAGDGGP
ncbi:MAG: hypothetical protein HY681_13465 [Chloroflexi bacterium]|nr:hypothetical protein [Chloroflexota bacterium]